MESHCDEVWLLCHYVMSMCVCVCGGVAGPVKQVCVAVPLWDGHQKQLGVALERKF